MAPFPPKNILVPFDLSTLSAAAWTQAVAFAGRFGSKLEVLYVQDWSRSELMPLPELPPEERRAILKRIRAVVGKAPKIFLAAGNPAAEILRSAAVHQADLIVMGTHGRTGLKRVLLGSVTEAVARQSPVPVLAVRGEPGPLRSLLAPVNFTDYSYYGFAYAAALAAGLGARLTALHVHVDPVWNGNPRHKLTKLLESLPPELRAACEPRVETREREALRGILEAEAKHDLIVLVAHEKSPVKEMILGTTAERVMRSARGPVLIVPAPRGSLPVRENLPKPCCAEA